MDPAEGSFHRAWMEHHAGIPDAAWRRLDASIGSRIGVPPEHAAKLRPYVHPATNQLVDLLGMESGVLVTLDAPIVIPIRQVRSGAVVGAALGDVDTLRLAFVVRAEGTEVGGAVASALGIAGPVRRFARLVVCTNAFDMLAAAATLPAGSYAVAPAYQGELPLLARDIAEQAAKHTSIELLVDPNIDEAFVRGWELECRRLGKAYRSLRSASLR